MKRTMAESEAFGRKIWEHFRSAASDFSVIRIVGEGPEDWLLQDARHFEEVVHLRFKLLRTDGQFASFDRAEGARWFAFTDPNVTFAIDAATGRIEFFHDRSSFKLYETENFVRSLRKGIL